MTAVCLQVVAHNARGEANVAAEEIIGYSGEDEPAEAPTNFTLIEIVGPRSATVSWAPVSRASIRGSFKGYKIQTWTEDSGEEPAYFWEASDWSKIESQSGASISNLENSDWAKIESQSGASNVSWRWATCLFMGQFTFSPHGY